MKFKDYHYQRPDMDAVKYEFEKKLAAFEGATSPEKQNALIEEINHLRSRVETMFELAMIRYTLDTRDAFNEAENDFADQNMPIYEGLVSDYYRALVDSPYRHQLEAQWGEQLFSLAECKLKTFKPDIIDLLQRENKLASEYRKLRSSASIEFAGEVRNLPQMIPFKQSPEQKIRVDAQRAETQFFNDNEAQFDRIYDDMVKVRHQIAKQLGFDNYVALGYARLMRTDYDVDMVANYRAQVKEQVVPIVNRLRKRQCERLGLETLKYYDEDLYFNTGNATPKGDVAWQIEQATTMYRELSPETDTFFSFMVDSDLLELEAKPGKSGGGYCTTISDYKAPFIFANANGTAGDIDTLTHEAGHAFQAYSSLHFALPEYHWPTYEACEVHSMSMEFLAWPWMKNFFKEDTEKFCFHHLEGAINFIPYGVLVDEFQHVVYQNPDMTPAERKTVWRELERTYLPYRDYADNDFLERGGYWFKQGHIFQDPFYYIDYTLAQVCAFEFWQKDRMDHKTAWADYLRLCQMGGSKPFLELLDLANLHNPFDSGTLKHILEPVVAWLDGVDDRAL